MSGPARAFFAPLAGTTALVAALVVPLYFTVFTERVFEPEKAALARSLGLLAAGAVLLAVLFERRSDGTGASWRRQPLVWAALAVWAVEALATALSVAPARSLFGAYTRGQGLYTTSALLALGAGAALLARREHGLQRLTAALGASVFPAALYGVLQRWDLDPLPWLGDNIVRVSGPAGNSVMLAAWLIMALPFAGLATWQAWRSARATPARAASLRLAAWLVTVALGAVALVLTASRGPLLGLAAGLVVAALALAAAAGRRRLALGVAAVALGLVVLIGLLNVPSGPLAAAARLPVLDRLATAFNPDNSTSRVRLRLWEGSVAAIAGRSRPLLGNGPETTDLVWAPYYPPILAYDEPRGIVPDRAHNLALDTLLTTGMLGLLALLAMLTLIIEACLAALGLLASTAERWRWRAFWLLGGFTASGLAVALDHGGRLAAPAFGAGLVVGLAAWLCWRAIRTNSATPALGLTPTPASQSLGHPEHPTAPTAGAAGTPQVAPKGAREYPKPLPPLGTGVGGGGARAVFALAALAAVIAHLIEVQVSFEVVATRLVLWLIVGALVGAAWPASSEGTTDDDSRSGTWDGVGAALVVGATLVFDFARFGLVGGGAMTVVALVAASVLLVGLAMAWSGTWERRRVAGTAAAVVVFAAIQVLLLTLGTHGTGDALWAVGASVAWYGMAVVAVIVTWTGLETGAWPARGALLAGTVVLGALVALAALTNGMPTVGDAAYKEGRLGWQASVQALRDAGQWGKAMSFLDRARARYAFAATWAPWEPTYALAMAREAVERADTLDESIARALSQANLPATTSEYGAPPSVPADLPQAVADRDQAFADALLATDRANSAAPGAPEPVLTRARALRVWGERTRDAERRTERLAQAAAALQVAIARAPNWPELYDEAAVTALDQGDPQGALARTQQAVAVDPFYLRAWRTAASADAASGDFETAAIDYARYFADDRNASDLAARRDQLVALTRLGRYPEALAVARSVTQLAPDDAHALADLAALQDRTGDRAAALASARRAAALAPSDAGIRGLVERLSGGR